MRFPECHFLKSHIRLLAVWILLVLVAPQISWAAGTSAGTIISNSATVSYDIGGVVQTPITSLPATFSVDELIYPLLTWQDTAPVSVNTPGTNDALTFLLTNVGNGTEAFSLVRTNGPLPLPPGNYTPLDGTVGSIYLENGLQAGFQASGPNADIVYVSGTNDPNLAPDASQIIYVISDTPAVANNIHGEVMLDAASLTAGAAGSPPGTKLAGLGQGGVFAVVGTNSAQTSSTGSYLTTGLGLVVNKTVSSVLDPTGGSVVMPGSVINYRINVKVTGTGTVTNLVITDPMPANTNYVVSTITITCISGTYTGGGACGTGTITPQPPAIKTDTNLDADFADFNGTTANTVTVSLGNVTAPAEFDVTFKATIN